MSDYANLPGINVTRLDGGLTASQSNTAPVILLLGTAPQGVGDEPYYCADESRALAAFGASSDLYRGFVEAKRAYGDGANVWLYRVGTTPATLRISGTNGKYVDVVPRNRVATVGDTYLGSFDGATNTLWIYDSNQNLVYSNYANNSVDSGAVDVRGDLTLLSGARSWGDPANGTYAGSVPLGNSALASGTVFTAANVGPQSSNAKAMYQALEDAYRMLDAFELDVVVPLGVYADSPNVAYFVSGVGGQERPQDPAYSVDNPMVNGSGTLGWFKAVAPSNGSVSWTYDWADDVIFGSGVTAASPHAWTGPAARLAAGYREVNFAHQLANFCYQHTKTEGTCLGVIGFRAPKSYYAADVYVWAGEAPSWDVNGNMTSNGYGIAGFVETQGCTAARLNPLCHDKASGRTPGFYATASEFKDDKALTDANGYPIDIGAYLSLVGDSPRHLNSLTGGTGYTNSAAAYYAGLVARLDQKQSPTNQFCGGLRVPYKLGRARLNDLVGARVVAIQQLTDGAYVVSAPTAAMAASDYQQVSTVRIVKLAEDVVREAARPYIGQASTTTMIAALQHDIEQALHNLLQRGYLRSASVVQLSASRAEQIIGKLNVALTLYPALELRHINVSVALALE
ncbi:MAG: hypothetical protein ABFD84_13115 [Candidatus Polarisedimenticolia bacterium]